jgi:putative hydrolase
LQALVDAVRDGTLVTLVAGRDGAALLDRVQATMAMIEGHAEHVMDAVGAELVEDLPALRVALDRRRGQRAPLLAWLERLIGLDLKLRQYKLGKAFCDGVVAEAGVARLHRAWASPELLPTLAELEDPIAWIARTDVPGVTKSAG